MSIIGCHTPSDQRVAPYRARRRVPHRATRRGVALFTLLVFLALAGLFTAGWLTSAAAERRAARIAEDRLQAAWLAESALQRAAARLERDGDYAGETWQVPADPLVGGANAIVDIKIERPNAEAKDAAANEGALVNAVVEVNLRNGDETVVRTRKQVSVRISKSEES